MVVTLGGLMLLKKIPIFDPIYKYIYWLIPRFMPIAKKTKLISKWLAKMIIRDNMIS